MKKIVVVILMGLAFVANAMGVMVNDGYARETPPGAINSAAFMMLHNHSSEARVLVKAESSAAKHVELHNHVNDNGKMMMRKVDGITVPAMGMTNLQPGGYHIMLLGLKHPLKSGEMIEMTLTFDNGSTQSLTVPVKAMGGGMTMHHH
jgi:copper(I)-binding protein